MQHNMHSVLQFALRAVTIRHMAPKTTPKKAAPKKRENTIHARLPVEEIEKLDALAKENNITRAAVVAIACARILKSGL